MFNQHDHDLLSLLDLKCDLWTNEDCRISREAIHKRFTPDAVRFLKELLARMMSVHFEEDIDPGSNRNNFTGIYIKDSTKIKLPLSYQECFPGYGSFNKETPLLNIQYEYDLVTQSWSRLELTKATTNDQSESKQTAEDIKQGSLNIRDLGYITNTYLKAVEIKNAFYLNRLPKIGVYQKDGDQYELVDWKSIERKIKKAGLPHLELEVYLGKGKLKSRMIMVPVGEELAKKRIRRAKQRGKRSSSKGYQLSKEYKIKAHYNIYITNVPCEKLSTDQVIKAYKLRWQIELMFKAWKSNLKIDRIKQVKKERMECQLLAKFIWILLNANILQASNVLLKSSGETKVCSPLKFFKRMRTLSYELRKALFDPARFIEWYMCGVYPTIKYLTVENRKKDPTHYQILMSVNHPLS